MRAPIIAGLLALWLCPALVAARTVSVRIADVETEVARLSDVRVRLHWPQGASAGELSLVIGRAEVKMLAEPFLRLEWRCPLRRRNTDGWQCAGAVRSGSAPPLHLAVEVTDAASRVELLDGASRVLLQRAAAAPDAFDVNLTQVPLAWLQQWLTTLWPDARLGAGRLDGTVKLVTGEAQPVRIQAALGLSDGALDTRSGEIAAAGLGMQAEITAEVGDGGLSIDVNGSLNGGELLSGNAYLPLPATPVTLAVQARQNGDGNWQLPRLIWRDGDVLEVQAELDFNPDATLNALRATLHSTDLAPWPQRYLSGWLGLAGLSGLTMSGALDAQMTVSDAGLESLAAQLRAINLHDAEGRFMLNDLNGDLLHVRSGEQHGELNWHSGSLGGIAFGPAHWPLHSRDGQMRLHTPVTLDVLGGNVTVQPLRLRLPHANDGLQLEFGLFLQQLDLGALTSVLGWPAFRGRITGALPAAHYANGRLELDGGLALEVFDGRIDVTTLAMERPFGVAPTLSANLALFDLDLLTITDVFDFGSISGRLDGRIDGLRLIDWTPTAFDAELHTVARANVRRRISQRAVQDISSVGDASFMHSLQSRLIGLFDDFRYRRIGIACRLQNEVCQMSGLSPSGAGFTIVEGAGIPRLNVVGFNREVDWPTLVERVMEAAGGDLSPEVR